MIKPNRFICMINGIKKLIKHKSFVVWLCICFVGIILGLISNIGMTQLVLLVAIACIGLALESGNTAIEYLLDFINPQYSDKVKTIKDITGVMPILVYSSYIICWFILVLPNFIGVIINAIH